MTTGALSDVIDRITSSAGLDDEVTSHRLRHTFGTELTRSGVDSVTVAEPGRARRMQRAVDLLTADG
jgi:site-specific recombinase XerD